MNLIRVTCTTCEKIFFRPAGKVNEANKFCWKQFCSIKCLAQSKIKGKTLVCANPKCRKKFYRSIGKIGKVGKNFCSRSCAAKINNHIYPKRSAPIKNCLYCEKIFKATDQKVYCSRKCKNKSQIIKEEKIIFKIKEFYKKEKRIPFKEEFPHYSAAQKRFGSWNKAIEAAGFESNPVKFAKKFIAKDGHKCDSLAEKIIDDWLYSNSIEHQRNIPYPNSSYTADFLIKEKFVEFLGLNGEFKEYDKNTKLKEKLAKKHKLKLIKIFPKDLFPINRLSEIFKR